MGGGGTLKNLKFENSTITMTASSGTVPEGFAFGVGANMGGKVENVHTANCSFTLVASYSVANKIGNIVGSNNPGAGGETCLIKNCTTSGGKIESLNRTNAGERLYSVGGILGAGLAGSGSRIENCANLGTVIYVHARAGGIAGLGSSVIDSYNLAPVSGWGSTGGIIGRANLNADNPCVIERCFNNGKVTYDYANTQGYMGGILAEVSGANSVTISECYNLATVEKILYTLNNMHGGGILGAVTGAATVTIENCFNAGDVTESANTHASNRSRLAGILGNINAAAAIVSITNCYSTGKITLSPTANPADLCAGIAANVASPFVTVTGAYYLTGSPTKPQAFDNLNAGATITDVPSDGKAASALSNPATYGPSWDFNAVWAAPSGSYAYPTLRNNPMR
jgi:hypothetical protein